MSVDSNLAGFPADDRPRVDLVTTFSGPAALAMLAGGDFPSFPAEILTLAPTVTGIAEIKRRTFAAALGEVTVRTSRLLRLHRTGILALADHLACRRYVSRPDPPIAQVLATAREMASRALIPAPRHEVELTRLVAGAPVDLAAFGQGVARRAREGGR